MNTSHSTLKPFEYERFELALKNYQARIDNVLTIRLEALIESPEQLSDAMRYGALLGGKRIRPYLVYAVGKLFNLPENVLDCFAVAVESIHAYSLIHDDLPAMDNDALRRGNPTCHIKFGEATAILAGDALQSFAFEILSSPELDIPAQTHIQVINLLAKASGAEGMCGGQMLDLLSEKQTIDVTLLQHIHEFKTGALISAAVKMSALAGVSKLDLHQQQVLAYLEKYSEAIGLAFQIQDDILDVIGDTATLGKEARTDEALGKNTYPSLLGLDQAIEKSRYLINEAQEQLVLIKELLDISPNRTYQLEALQELNDLAEFIILRKR